MGIGSGLGSFAAAMEASDLARRKREYEQRKYEEHIKQAELTALAVSPKGAYTDMTPVEVANSTMSSARPAAKAIQQASGYKAPEDKVSDINASLLKGIDAKQYDIPTTRHGKQKPTSIVGHRTAGTGFNPNDPRLTEKGLGAHYTVLSDGSMAVVNSPETKMWHAGPKGNANSIGIEVVGRYKDQVKNYGGEWDATGGWEPMTDAQKKTLKTFGERLINYYGISEKNIQPHYKLAAKSGTEGQQVVDVLKAWYR